jgi:predicted RNase H-like nuclease/AcrR family transcriptional regulator
MPSDHPENPRTRGAAPAIRGALSRDRVVAEAVALADAEGLAALSMRALAGRLGVEAMSLYHHVASKEGLLDAMLDVVFAEMHLPVIGADWRTELRARSISGRTVLLRHRWAVGLMDSRRAPGPESIRHHDAVLGCLAAQGFSLEAAGTTFALLDAHLYGFMAQEVSLPFTTVDELAEIGAALIGPEVRAAFPHFTRYAEERAMQPGYAFGNEFEPSLDLVLGALEGLRENPEASTSAPAAAPVANPTGPDPVEVTLPVLGVDACPGGWVGALLVPGAPRPRVVVAPNIAGLVEMVRADVDVLVVGIDIPIGLPDSTPRQADALARKELPGRASTVFTTLTRSAYLADTRVEADAVNRRLSGQGVGAQAFGLKAKILEVDAWLRTRPTVEVIEVHPEVSFAEMAGAPLPPKRTPEGHDQRLATLAASGIARPSVLKGSGYAPDDVLDACAVAWSAHRRATGDARRLPDPPEVFSDGIRAAIHI